MNLLREYFSKHFYYFGTTVWSMSWQSRKTCMEWGETKRIQQDEISNNPSPILTIFSIDSTEHHVMTDSSSIGVRATHLQRKIGEEQCKPVHYISTRHLPWVNPLPIYCQELCAIFYSLTKFYKYLVGSIFLLHTHTIAFKLKYQKLPRLFIESNEDEDELNQSWSEYPLLASSWQSFSSLEISFYLLPCRCPRSLYPCLDAEISLRRRIPPSRTYVVFAESLPAAGQASLCVHRQIPPMPYSLQIHNK